MAVPDFQTIMRPLLDLHADGDEHEIAATRNAVADHFQLSDEDRAERIPSGRVTTLQNRVGWAATYLFRSGLLQRPRRAHYRITDRGRQMLAENPDRIDLSVLKQFDEFEQFRRAERSAALNDRGSSTGASAALTDTATAEERIYAGYQELRAALVADLLDRVREQS